MILLRECLLQCDYYNRGYLDNVYQSDCVVPENIQTPTMEGISLRTPHPLWIFHFCRELIPPPPPHSSGISTSMTKTPQPLWKSSFSRRKTIKLEE